MGGVSDSQMMSDLSLDGWNVRGPVVAEGRVTEALTLSPMRFKEPRIEAPV